MTWKITLVALVSTAGRCSSHRLRLRCRGGQRGDQSRARPALTSRSTMMARASRSRQRTAAWRSSGGDSATIPDGFPSDMPLYDGDLVMSQKFDTEDGVAYNIGIKTSDGANDVAEWYSDEFASEGWTVTTRSTNDTGDMAHDQLPGREGRPDGSGHHRRRGRRDSDRCDCHRVGRPRDPDYLASAQFAPLDTSTSRGTASSATPDIAVAHHLREVLELCSWAPRRRVRRGPAAPCAQAKPSSRSLLVHLDHGELDDVGGRALHRVVHRRALTERLEVVVAALELRDPALASEHRDGVPVSVGLRRPSRPGTP